MRKLWLIFLILCYSGVSFGQGIPQKSRIYSFTASGSSPSKDWAGLGYGFYKVKWDTQNGTFSACTFTLQGGHDGITFGSTIISSQTCTSDGETIVTGIGSNDSSWIRVNVSALTVSFGTPVLSVTVSAWNEVIGATVSNPIVITTSTDSSFAPSNDIVCGSSVMFDGTTTGLSQLVALSGTKHIYVCGYEVMAGGTVNVGLFAGTGSNCGSAISGATNVTLVGGSSGQLTPMWQLTAQTGKITAWPTHGYLFDAGSGNAVCSKLSGSVQAEVQMWYMQR